MTNPVEQTASLALVIAVIPAQTTPDAVMLLPGIVWLQTLYCLLTVNSACNTIAGLHFGGVPEWSKGSDCKSDGSAFGGSNPPLSTIFTSKTKLVSKAGIAQLARASAFQAEGRGFESRFPLQIEWKWALRKDPALALIG